MLCPGTNTRLRRTCRDCQVFEAAPDYRPQGAGVLVNLNGQHAIEAIDPELYRRCCPQAITGAMLIKLQH